MNVPCYRPMPCAGGLIQLICPRGSIGRSGDHTCMASLFPNEASLRRLVSAIPIKTSEEWEISRKNLTLEYDLLPN